MRLFLEVREEKEKEEGEEDKKGEKNKEEGKWLKQRNHVNVLTGDK
jgi:hypothetical protein